MAIKCPLDRTLQCTPTYLMPSFGWNKEQIYLNGELVSILNTRSPLVWSVCEWLLRATKHNCHPKKRWITPAMKQRQWRCIHCTLQQCFTGPLLQYLLFYSTVRKTSFNLFYYFYKCIEEMNKGFQFKFWIPIYFGCSLYSDSEFRSNFKNYTIGISLLDRINSNGIAN